MSIEVPGYRLVRPVFTAAGTQFGVTASSVGALDVTASDTAAPDATLLDVTAPEMTGMTAAAGGGVAHADSVDGIPVGVASAMWRGVRIADDRPVAIKLFPADGRERAEREAVIGQTVDHAHVLSAIDIVTTPELVALVFPWADGGSLARLVHHRRRLPWPEALTVLIPLADALAAAHERGFVHGDVSADNVLFDADGRPLLADFGAARAAREFGIPVHVTPADVAPEIVRGAPASAAGDLFSLGSVALRCLSGAAAWPADDLEDVIAQSAIGQWPDIDDRLAPDAFCRVIRRLLAPEPADRGSAGRLAVDLRAVGRPEPIGLVTSDDDGALRGPAASTVLRPDAVRPPVVPGAPRHRLRGRSPAGRPRSWRVAAVALAVGAVLAGAVVAGWSWAGQGSGRPVVADAPATHSRTPVTTTPGTEAAGTATETARDAAGAHRGEEPAHGTAPNHVADWLSVITGLDAARSTAFVSGDASALDAVYADGAAGRIEDEARMTALAAAGQRVTAAEHGIQSATLVDLAPSGDATVDVVETLPAYPVYGKAGALVGYTAPVAQATVRIHLQADGDGYRIREIAPAATG
ncbi:MAG: hypothetical protein BGO26_07340 [Actinobacteria bacterium 69-20]|nr:serine/threonine protein kinase [Actinomycetota bacterium]OJV30173.1 MAG: hypothetical protein BGO26_07340 [Actinobacteria bacterium 69-20]